MPLPPSMSRASATIWRALRALSILAREAIVSVILPSSAHSYLPSQKLGPPRRWVLGSRHATRTGSLVQRESGPRVHHTGGRRSKGLRAPRRHKGGRGGDP